MPRSWGRKELDIFQDWKEQGRSTYRMSLVSRAGAFRVFRKEVT